MLAATHFSLFGSCRSHGSAVEYWDGAEPRQVHGPRGVRWAVDRRVSPYGGQALASHLAWSGTDVCALASHCPVAKAVVQRCCMLALRVLVPTGLLTVGTMDCPTSPSSFRRPGSRPVCHCPWPAHPSPCTQTWRWCPLPASRVRHVPHGLGWTSPLPLLPGTSPVPPVGVYRCLIGAVGQVLLGSPPLPRPPSPPAGPFISLRTVSGGCCSCSGCDMLSTQPEH